MAKLAIIKGKGEMQVDGKTVMYPVNKLVICTNDGYHQVEVKLDKVARQIIPYMFDVQKREEKYEDENGVVCDFYLLNDKKA